MGSRTPFEGWCGRKPQLGHLKVFGCRANVRPAVPHLKKLDARSVAIVYFGVEEGSKAHRLYDALTRKIVVSREVIFEETEAWKWNSEFGENSEFVVEDNGVNVTQLWNGGVTGGDNHDDHHSGDVGETSSENQPTREAVGSDNAGTGSQSDTVFMVRQ